MMEKEIQEIINSHRLTLINFKSPQCDPCQMIEPNLQQVKKAIGKRVEIHTFDVNHLPIIINEFQIFTLPTLILFSNGNIVWKTNEVLSKEEIIKKILNNEF